MKKGFTLIELLVVIAIVGILIGVLIGTFSDTSESARAARCLTNLKNLASAVHMAANNSASGGYLYFPPAGSRETFSVDASQGSDQAVQQIGEDRGWISWYSKGVYASKPTSAQASSSWTVSMYDQNEERRLYALTNGAIWKLTGCNHQMYLCPTHVKKQKALNPNYSYVMSAALGWSPSPGEDLIPGSSLSPTDMTRAERKLLLAEIPFADVGTKSPTATSGYECDAILQYKECCTEGSYNEIIGFNHKTGKNYSANVVFMDGHTEKLLYPKEGLSETEMQDLTQWLCVGKDVSFDGRKYDEMKQ